MWGRILSRRANLIDSSRLVALACPDRSLEGSVRRLMPMNAATRIANNDVFCEADAVRCQMPIVAGSARTDAL
jgi:hypothetical protein